MKTALVMPDVHVPYEDTDAMRCMLRVCKLLQPDYFICLGDFFDFYQLSRFDKNPLRKTTVSDDCDVARRLLYKIDGALPLKTQKVFIEGNHEMRLIKWIHANASDLGKMIPSLKDYVHFSKLGWDYLPYGKLFRLGDVLYMHGDRCGMNVSINMIRKYGCSVVHGHDHGAAVRWFANAVGRMFALNCGHLSDIDQQEYIYGGVADWTQGFGLVEYTHDLKHAQGSFVPIVNGKALVRGQLV